jgi:hypothetical protein
VGFWNIFKGDKTQKQSLSSLLFFHEDDFCQVELLPKENLNFIKLQCNQIESSSEKNFDGAGYKEIFIRDANPIGLSTISIQKSELENFLLELHLPRASEVLTGYGQDYRVQSLETVGFGSDYVAVYFHFQDDIVKKIWFTQIWNITGEKLVPVLNKVGLKWNLLLVDWEAATFVELSDEQAIINYLN